ncbi:MAG: hypothetical protein QW814_03575 [Methanothrix sp.]
MQKRHEASGESEEGNKLGGGSHKIFGRIDEGQAKIDSHYNELMELQRKSIAAINTSSYEDTKKALVAKEVQFYKDLADQHERFAGKARISSYINSSITAMDAVLVTYCIAFGVNVLVTAVAGVTAVAAGAMAAISIRQKKKNENLAAARREKANMLELGDPYD